MLALKLPEAKVQVEQNNWVWSWFFLWAQLTVCHHWREGCHSLALPTQHTAEGTHPRVFRQTCAAIHAGVFTHL